MTTRHGKETAAGGIAPLPMYPVFLLCSSIDVSRRSFHRWRRGRIAPVVKVVPRYLYKALLSTARMNSFMRRYGVVWCCSQYRENFR